MRHVGWMKVPKVSGVSRIRSTEILLSGYDIEISDCGTIKIQIQIIILYWHDRSETYIAKALHKLLTDRQINV